MAKSGQVGVFARTLALFVVAIFMQKLNAEELLLQGAVGKYPVVMSLRDFNGDVTGTYFYEKYKQDMELRGTLKEKTYQLDSEMYDPDKMDRFVLIRGSDGFTGQFMGRNGVKLPVRLHLVTPTSVPNPRPDLHFTQPLNGYEKLRLSGMAFMPGENKKVNGKYGIQWIMEPRSRTSMFHVVSGYPDPVASKINAAIDANLYNKLIGYFRCADGQGGSGTEILEISHYYLDDFFVSYSVSSSWSCFGAAHPDFGTSGTTIDAHTGKVLTLEDVYWVGKADKPVPGSSAWMQYRSQVFAPSIVQLLTRLYPNEMKAVDDDDACNYSDPEIWAFGPWYLTEKGLYLGAIFPRVTRACDNPEWSFIPFSVLKKNNPALFGR